MYFSAHDGCHSLERLRKMCKQVQLISKPDRLEAGRIEGLRSVALNEIEVLLESKSTDDRDRCRGSHSGFLQAQAGDELEES